MASCFIFLNAGGTSERGNLTGVDWRKQKETYLDHYVNYFDFFGIN